MSTENEEWREDSKSENTDAGRDGNRSFNREGGYSRPSYNREGGDRPYRPRFNSNILFILLPLKAFLGMDFTLLGSVISSYPFRTSVRTPFSTRTGAT